MVHRPSGRPPAIWLSSAQKPERFVRGLLIDFDPGSPLPAAPGQVPAGQTPPANTADADCPQGRLLHQHGFALADRLAAVSPASPPPITRARRVTGACRWQRPQGKSPNAILTRSLALWTPEMVYAPGTPIAIHHPKKHNPDGILKRGSWQCGLQRPLPPGFDLPDVMDQFGLGGGTGIQVLFGMHYPVQANHHGRHIHYPGNIAPTAAIKTLAPRLPPQTSLSGG